MEEEHKRSQAVYKEVNPVAELEHVVHSFWMHHNPTDAPEHISIFPDSFFKIVILVHNGQVVKYFMTGLWNEPIEFTFPPGAASYGCRLRILAPEFLISREIGSIHNSFEQLDLNYLSVDQFDLSNFESIVRQWQDELLKIKPDKDIPGHKLRLSQLLYQMRGSISATEVSDQIFWSNRQINRYMNQYLGMSLKKYLNIQKCYEAYIQIREGNFIPEKDYFDQAHFIKEVKKHTGQTPKTLYKRQNDRFIQLKNIRRK